MKATILYCTLLIAFHASGQKCHFTIDKQDEFNGEKINTIVYTTSNWTWVSSKKGEKYFIDLSFQSVESQKSITTRDSMQVKLVNGTILVLKPNAEALPVGGTISKTVSSTSSTHYYATERGTNKAVTTSTNVTTYSPSFEVDRSVYEKLSQSEIKTIRFDFTGKPWDFDFSQRPLSKAGPVLKNNARCILTIN